MKKLLIFITFTVILLMSCKEIICPDYNCPECPKCPECQDTVIVTYYAFKDGNGNLYTDNPFAVIIERQNWLLAEINKLNEKISNLQDTI